MKETSFYIWLKRQRKRDCGIGDLARYAIASKDFPVNSHWGTLTSYLKKKNCHPFQMQSFHQAWGKYRKKYGIEKSYGELQIISPKIYTCCSCGENHERAVNQLQSPSSIWCCSESCKKERLKNNITICLNCSKEFNRILDNRKGKKTCSDSCSDFLYEQGKKRRQEKIRKKRRSQKLWDEHYPKKKVN